MSDKDFNDEQRVELGDLQPLYRRLSEYDVPEPNSARLLAKLTPLLPKQAETTPAIKHRGFGDWLRLAWAQTQLVEMPFWLSSVMLTLVGLVLALSDNSDLIMLWLVLLSPLLAAAGVGYIFRPATHTLWELERLSHVQPFELLYARLALILLWNVTLAGALMLMIWSQHSQIILWRLLLIWFGPMIGLTGLALFCSVRWNTFVGVVMPMIAWAGIVFLGWRDMVLSLPVEMTASQSIIMQIGMSNSLLLIALVSLIGGLVLVAASGRWVTQWR
jgi:hypothetical protein